jgi:ADP-ribose pyrophosphatase YjhB (NUDIX family)
VVLDNDSRILLVKHIPKEGDFWGGQWMVPGGGLEPGETLEEGVAREVEEETNLKVQVLKHVSTLDRIVREGDEVKIHVVYVDFLVRPVGGELRPGSDVGSARWFSRDEIGANWEEIHVDTRRLLEKIGFVMQGAVRQGLRCAQAPGSVYKAPVGAGI